MERYADKGVLEKEWENLLKQEAAYKRRQRVKKESLLNQSLAEKIPPKLQDKLDRAFAKAFELVFEKGTGYIEKTYQKERLEQDYQVRDYAARLTGKRKEMRKFHQKAQAAGTKNLLISGVEGIGLGILGIGLPDIPIFVGVLLKSIYEIALNYGYTYDTEKEQSYILQLIQNAFSYGDEFEHGERRLAQLSGATAAGEKTARAEEIRQTSSVLSKELLYMKFLQGIPIVGAVGGMYDTIYLQRIIKYAKIKYKRRFLSDWKNNYL